MTECHHPRVNADYLARLLRDEVRRHADPHAGLSFNLDDLETLLRAAEERNRPRTALPPQLHRFPFTWSARLQQLFLKVYKRLFHDQRAVNTVLIQALRETLAVNRYLLHALAAREADGGPSRCAS
jgi:hypothetical protein